MGPDKDKLLTVFLKNGRTLLFHRVENVAVALTVASADILTFTYASVSQPGTRSSARFKLGNIAGFSRSE